MKKLHAHHSKKRSYKNHSSKVKVRKFSALTEGRVKVHTRTKIAKAEKKIENLKLSAAKLPNKKFYTKSDIENALVNGCSLIPGHQIKLMLNKLNSLREHDINRYREQGLTLSNLIEKIISDN